MRFRKFFGRGNAFRELFGKATLSFIVIEGVSFSLCVSKVLKLSFDFEDARSPSSDDSQKICLSDI